jgi:RNA polymerase sigma-70 factor (ECF subfamily)
MTDPLPKSMLEFISTCWPMIHNPVQFVMKYARAIHKYVAALVRDPHDAEEVAQEFLTRVFDKGFCPENVSRGRFRDYLKSAVRFVAISHLRRKRPTISDDQVLMELVGPEHDPDQAWSDEWRACLLERIWQKLELHQQQTEGNLYFSVLQIMTEDPKSTSDAHAARLARQLGRPYRADAFRQQSTRARRHFAKLIVEEIQQTLQNPSAESVEQELVDLKLMPYVRDFLK